MAHHRKSVQSKNNMEEKIMTEINNKIVLALGGTENANVFVAGDTMVLTNKGHARIDDLANEAKPVTVWNGKDFSNLTPKITGENQPLLEIRFSDGAALKCGPHQEFILADGSRVEAEGLKVGDVLVEYRFPVIFGGEDLPDKMAYTAGFFSGDGSVDTRRKDNSIWLYGRKQDLLNQFDYRYVNKCAGDRLAVTIDGDRYKDKTFVPGANYTVETRLEWLAGLLDSDGTYQASGQSSGGYQISSINKEFLVKVKFLLNTLGIRGHVALNKKATVKAMPDGKGGMKEYFCQACYCLVICQSAAAWLTSLGLRPKRLAIAGPPSRACPKPISIVSVEPLDGTAETVYGFSTPKECGAMAMGLPEDPSTPYEACAA